MMWNLQSYPKTALDERMWHFRGRGSKHTLTPPTYFQGGQDPLNPMIYTPGCATLCLWLATLLKITSGRMMMMMMMMVMMAYVASHVSCFAPRCDTHAYISTEKSYHSAHISHPRMPTVACDVQLSRNTDRVAVIDQWRNFNQSSWEVCEL